MSKEARKLLRRVVIGTTALTLIACGGKDGGSEGGGGSTDSGDLTLKTHTFEERRDADQRPMNFQVAVKVPAGWEPDPKARSMRSSVAYMAPRDGLMTMSRVTVSATCQGSCRPDKLQGQIEAMAEMQFESALGKEKKLAKRPEKDGVRAFVVEDERAVIFGVSHLQPGWPRIVYCEGYFQGDYIDDWKSAYQACIEAEVSLEDPLMPMALVKKETANLAKCPKTSSLTFTPLEERENQPNTFGDVKTVYAHASRPGNVSIYLANFDMTTARFRGDGALKEGQHVVSLRLEGRETVDEKVMPAEIFSGAYGTLTKPTKVDIGLYVAGRRTLQWSTHSTEGTVDIIARTADKVCGTIKISKGKRGTLEGAFVADLQVGSKK